VLPHPAHPRSTARGIQRFPSRDQLFHAQHPALSRGARCVGHCDSIRQIHHSRQVYDCVEKSGDENSTYPNHLARVSTDMDPYIAIALRLRGIRIVDVNESALTELRNPMEDPRRLKTEDRLGVRPQEGMHPHGVPVSIRQGSVLLLLDVDAFTQTQPPHSVQPDRQHPRLLARVEGQWRGELRSVRQCVRHPAILGA
jgi:hypothetical protein